MNISSLSKYALLFTTLIVLTVFGACSNSVSEDDHDHADAEGFRLKMNGQTIVEQLPGGSLTGAIEIEPGEETDLITIYFLDDDGDEFHPHEEDGFSLGYEFEDEGIVEFEQHEEDGAWSFHLHAEDVEDHTEMRLMLKHGGHSDFTTLDIHVHVESE